MKVVRSIPLFARTTLTLNGALVSGQRRSMLDDVLRPVTGH